VPAKPGTRADFALVAEIAKKCGIELEGRSPLLVMNQLSASEPAFGGISYAKLAEVTEQWPIIGRSDLFYGGTGYENKQGLGMVLESKVSRLSLQSRETFDSNLRPKEDELFAVPISKLYDNGTTVAPAKLLSAHIERFNGVFVNPATAEKLGFDNGGQATVSLEGVEAQVKVLADESISAGVVLIPRSFNIPIKEPVAVKLSAVAKAQEA
jgi:NADH-quinone oxidoreductase subunit G